MIESNVPASQGGNAGPCSVRGAERGARRREERVSSLPLVALPQPKRWDPRGSPTPRRRPPRLWPTGALRRHRPPCSAADVQMTECRWVRFGPTAGSSRSGELNGGIDCPPLSFYVADPTVVVRSARRRTLATWSRRSSDSGRSGGRGSPPRSPRRSIATLTPDTPIPATISW